MLHRDAEDAGFTVLEAVVALAILSICLTALYAAIGSAYRASAIASTRERLLAIARSELELAKADGLETGKRRNGQTADGFKWRITMTPAEGFDGSTPPKKGGVKWVIFEAIDPEGRLALRLQTARVTSPAPQ